jgi:hypothetical protein
MSTVDRNLWLLGGLPSPEGIRVLGMVWDTGGV